MTHEQREEYIRQAKKSFQSAYGVSKSYLTEERTETESKKGFWKARLLIAVLLFVGVCSLRQTNVGNNTGIQEKIAAMIQKDMDARAVAVWFEQENTADNERSNLQ